MLYDFKVKDIEGNEVSLGEYKGKVLLIVNTATGCGFTPQYEGLEVLYKKYHDKGFEILDFPCNQFFEQAPGSNEEIVGFCKLNYGTTFKTFAKVEVNGENACELYIFALSCFIFFLIDKNGEVVARFAPTFEPEKLDELIEELLEE